MTCMASCKMVIQNCIRKIHAKGYCHGDFRSPNILVNIKNYSVKIIDFDWAGESGIVKYPMFMNHDWPDSAKDGKLILKEYDDYWMQKIKQEAHNELMIT